MKVENATIQDVSEFVELWRNLIESIASYGVKIRWSDKTLTFYLKHFFGVIEGQINGYALKCLDDDGKILGMCLAIEGQPSMIDDEYTKKLVSLGVCVKESERGKGIGSGLYSFLTRMAKDDGFSHVFSSVAWENVIARKVVQNHNAVPAEVVMVVDLKGY